MTDKPKFPRAQAIEAARELCLALAPACERIIVAGSLRRRKETVGDVEILYIPRIVPVMDGLFDIVEKPATDAVLIQLLGTGVLAMRKTIEGHTTWGPKNKYAVHHKTNIPVDLFTATPANWWNYLVCRTGSAENNVRIAAAAQARGWKWHPYDSGFSRQIGVPDDVKVTSEREVSDFVRLPYLDVLVLVVGQVLALLMGGIGLVIASRRTPPIAEELYKLLATKEESASTTARLDHSIESTSTEINALRTQLSKAYGDFERAIGCVEGHLNSQSTRRPPHG